MSQTISPVPPQTAPTRRAARRFDAAQILDRSALDAEIDALARESAGNTDQLRKAAVTTFLRTLEQGHLWAREQLKAAGAALIARGRFRISKTRSSARSTAS